MAASPIPVGSAPGDFSTTEDATVAVAAVPGVGTVLVNGNGLVLYTFSADAIGKPPHCGTSGGCSEVWVPAELPTGESAAIAGSGIDTTKLGQVTASTGFSYATYAGYPLYVYAGDSGPLVASGQGRVAFGGTWSTMTPAGVRVGPATPTPGASATA